MTAGQARGVLGVLPIVRPVRAARPILLGTFYALALLPLTWFPKTSDNVLSRYLAIEAVATRGTLVVDQTNLFRFSRPVDLVRFNGHYYSDKPPVLVVIASPIYFLLDRLGFRFTKSLTSLVVMNLALTWLIVGLSSTLTLVWLRRLFQTIALSPVVADLLALAFGFTSQLLTYAVTFNNHSVAAACVLGAITLTVLERSGVGWARLDRFGVGLLAGLAATIDLPSGCLVLAGLGILQAARVRSIPWMVVLGSVGPLLLHAWLQSRVTGTPLPAEMYPEGFNYPGSFWLTDEGTFREYGPRWQFAMEMILGPAGWLTITPVLAIGLVGLGPGARSTGRPIPADGGGGGRHPGRPGRLLCLGGAADRLRWSVFRRPVTSWRSRRRSISSRPWRSTGSGAGSSRRCTW